MVRIYRCSDPRMVKVLEGPLRGTRVLDLTRALSGPLCTMILGDFGADVIKIELPGVGDETRHWGPPFVQDAGPTFVSYNRNKRSCVLDLHSDIDRRRCLDLCRTCDVLVENFRPGTMKRFGLAYEMVKDVRPNIIYCSLSGYGQEGELAGRPAMDLLVQAASGLMSLTGEEGGRAMKAAAPVADVMGGVSAALAILGAIVEAKGTYLDISMLDGMLALMGQAIGVWGMTGQGPRRLGNGHPLMAPYESFGTAEGEIVLAITNEKSWSHFCSIKEFQHLKSLTRFETQAARTACRDELVPILQGIFLQRSADYWLRVLEEADVPAEPVRTLNDIMEHPQVRDRRMLLEFEYPQGSGRLVRAPGVPWRAMSARGDVRPPPSLGQHTQEVMSEIL